MRVYLPTNLRAMRKALGETKRDLAEVINADVETIDAYENGKKPISSTDLSGFSKHFSCSADRMMYEDLSHATIIRSDIYSTWKRMDTVFPIVYSERAMENDYFRSAFHYHQDIFDGYKTMNPNPLQNRMICLELYTKAIESSEIEEEVTANMTSLAFMVMYLMKWFVMVRTQPQTQRQPNNQSEALIRDAFVRLGPSLEPIAKQLDENDFWSDLREMVVTLKRSGNYSELGDYYLALMYVLNIVDNDMPLGGNIVAGGEMIRTLLFIKNKYARKYLLG